jgi:gliding motility-associated-like protein
MKALFRFGIYLLFFGAPLLMRAQWDYPQFNMAQTTINDCFGRLYDSGGPTSSYGLNENITTTIEADGIVTLTFYGAFSLQENVDFLTVYDGTVAGGSMLGVFTGQESPGQLVATSGTVTLVFTSDGSLSTAGFSLYWSSEVAMPVPPGLSVPNPPACNSSALNIELSSPIPCSWFDNAVFEVISASDIFEVVEIDANCAAGLTELITLTLDEPLSYNCNILINLTIQIPDACGTLHEFELGTSFLFDNCPINAQIISESPTVCPGGCTSLRVETEGCFNYSYSWSNGLVATAGPHTVCPAATTVYSLVITELETSQQLSLTYTISIENVQIFTQDQTICQSAPDVLLQAGTSGAWSGPGVTGGLGSFDPDMAGAGTHTIYFNSANCIDSMQITVTPISAQFAAAACPGSAPFQLSATPSGGIWSGLQVNASGVFTPSAEGTYQAIYTVNSCVDVTNINVSEIVGPFVLDPICQSAGIITLDVEPFGGAWTGPGIVNSTGGTFNPLNAPPGDVTLNYALNGCDADFSVFIKDIDILESEVLCPLEAPSVLDATPIPLGGLWSSPDGAITNQNTGMFNPGIFSDDTETFITYQALNGCVDTMHITIISPEVEVEEISFCVTSTVVNIDESLVGAVSPEGGSWLGPGINGSTGSGFTLNPQALPIGLNYIYYRANNCEDSVLVRIFASNLPDAPQNFCSSDSPAILALTVPGGTWSGSGIVDPSTGLFDPSVADEGTYFVLWENPEGCNDSILVTIETEVQPLISGINDIYCSQDYEVNFSVSPTGGLLVGSLASTSFNPSELADGDYTVIYKIVPMYCSEVADTAEFTVYPPLVLEPLVASADPVCFEETSSITADANGGYPNNTLTYAWSNGGPNAATNTQAYSETTVVTLLVDDGCSQPQTANIEINVFPRFDVTITTSDTLCLGDDGFVELDFTPNGNYTVEWNGVEGNSGLYSADAGTGVQINITDVNGCDRDTSALVPAFPQPVAAFTINPDELCVPFDQIDNIQLINNAQNAVSGVWRFGDGTSAPFVPGEDVVHAYELAGQVTVSLSVVSEGEGCTDSTAIGLCLQPLEPVFVPDIFSPNEDGKNDTLYVRGLFISRLEFRVYSRWGEVVFETNSPTKGWDGNLRGSPAPSGSYYYTLFATIGDVTKIEQVGEVVLIR